MEAAQYPERSCREGIYNDVGVAYNCELVNLHPGPCASFSVGTSVTRRNQWEDANPDWRKSVGVMDDVV